MQGKTKQKLSDNQHQTYLTFKQQQSNPKPNKQTITHNKQHLQVLKHKPIKSKL